VTASPFNDTTAEPGVVYYYWVKANNAVGDSAFSLVNTGYRWVVYTTLTINGSSAWGSIYPTGDADWFRIVVTTPGIYVIQTWAGTLYDNYMWLYGPNSTTALIASNDDGGPGMMANITRSLSVGTYYIKIKPYYIGTTGNYVIRVESAPTRPASLAVNGNPLTVTCNFAGDTDTYSFVVATAGTHTINTTAGTLSDNFMFLYGPNSQIVLLQTDDDGGTGYMARISRSLAVGTYYVRFISYWGWGTGASGTFTARVTRP
jgi:tyrosinase